MLLILVVYLQAPVHLCSVASNPVVKTVDPNLQAQIESLENLSKAIPLAETWLSNKIMSILN